MRVDESPVTCRTPFRLCFNIVIFALESFVKWICFKCLRAQMNSEVPPQAEQPAKTDDDVPSLHCTTGLEDRYIIYKSMIRVIVYKSVLLRLGKVLTDIERYGQIWTDHCKCYGRSMVH